MNDKFNIKIRFDVTTLDGQPFTYNSVEWFGVPYGGVLHLEKKLLELLHHLNNIGQERMEREASGVPNATGTS